MFRFRFKFTKYIVICFKTSAQSLQLPHLVLECLIVFWYVNVLCTGTHIARACAHRVYSMHAYIMLMYSSA